MYPIKQSTAITVPFFVHDASGDAVTGLTDGTFTKRISKNGAAWGAMTVTISEMENGWYSIPLSTSHSDTLGLLSITFTNASAKQVNLQFRVEAKLVDDLNDISTANVATELATYDGPTNAEMEARTLVAASYFDPAADTVALVTDITTKTGFSLAATGLDAIGQAATGMVEIAKAVWDRVLSGALHNIASSAGKRLRQLDAAFEVTSGTAVAGSTSTTINLNSADGADVTTDDIYSGDRVVIVGGTGVGEHGIIISYASGTQIATMSKAWVVTPDNTSEYILVPADADVETWNNTAVTGDGDWAAQKAETVLILADTNELQTDWADAGRLDAILDAIKAVTDAVPDSGAMTSIAQASALTTVDTVVDAIKVITDALGATAAANLALSMGAAGCVTGAAEAGTLSTTVMTSDLAEATDDHYIGRAIIWTSGVLLGQASDLTDYSGTAGAVTYTAVTEAPSAGDAFIIV
jgi:hypothetical protein